TEPGGRSTAFQVTPQSSVVNVCRGHISIDVIIVESPEKPETTTRFGEAGSITTFSTQLITESVFKVRAGGSCAVLQLFPASRLSNRPPVKDRLNQMVAGSLAATTRPEASKLKASAGASVCVDHVVPASFDRSSALVP